MTVNGLFGGCAPCRPEVPRGDTPRARGLRFSTARPVSPPGAAAGQAGGGGGAAPAPGRAAARLMPQECAEVCASFQKRIPFPAGAERRIYHPVAAVHLPCSFVTAYEGKLRVGNSPLLSSRLKRDSSHLEKASLPRRTPRVGSYSHRGVSPAPGCCLRSSFAAAATRRSLHQVPPELHPFSYSLSPGPTAAATGTAAGPEPRSPPEVGAAGSGVLPSSRAPHGALSAAAAGAGSVCRGLPGAGSPVPSGDARAEWLPGIALRVSRAVRGTPAFFLLPLFMSFDPSTGFSCLFLCFSEGACIYIYIYTA